LSVFAFSRDAGPLLAERAHSVLFRLPAGGFQPLASHRFFEGSFWALPFAFFKI
jgi:hypothetical protein